MSTLVDLSGESFGRLRVLARVENGPDGRARWLCVCNCGLQTIVLGKCLRSRHTTSCGCRKNDRVHGHLVGHRASPTYFSWQTMIQRCKNQKAPNYSYYGGRSIKVCGRWLSFENFLTDMGVRPEGLTLDRIDSDGDYEPGNCRWASWKEQMANRRMGRRVKDAQAILIPG